MIRKSRRIIIDANVAFAPDQLPSDVGLEREESLSELKLSVLSEGKFTKSTRVLPTSLLRQNRFSGLNDLVTAE